MLHGNDIQSVPAVARPRYTDATDAAREVSSVAVRLSWNRDCRSIGSHSPQEHRRRRRSSSNVPLHRRDLSLAPLATLEPSEQNLPTAHALRRIAIAYHRYPEPRPI